jgi:hypothetical protein
LEDSIGWLGNSLLGEVAFNLGAAVGLAQSLWDQLKGLYMLSRTFILAAQYEIAVEANRYHLPQWATSGVLSGVESVFGLSAFSIAASSSEEKNAYDEVQSLTNEIKNLIEGGGGKAWALLNKLGGRKWQQAKSDWNRYQSLVASGNPGDMFDAGIMFGHLIGELLTTILLLITLAGAAVRIARLAATGVRSIVELAGLVTSAEGTEIGAAAKTLANANTELQAAQAAGDAKRIAGAEKNVVAATRDLQQKGEELQQAIEKNAPNLVKESNRLKEVKSSGDGARGGSGSGSQEEPPPTPDNRKWRTEPTKERGEKPRGKRTINEPNQPSGKKRAIAIENDTAERLANAGYDVEQNPDITGTTKKPDYRIQGEVFDCYAPEEGTPAENIVKAMNDKATRGQADRIVLNLKDTDITRSDLRDALNNGASPNLKEVIVVDQSGNIIRFYP